MGTDLKCVRYVRSCRLEMWQSNLPVLLSDGSCLCVNFNLEHSIPTNDEVGHKPAGTKVDVYLESKFSSYCYYSGIFFRLAQVVRLVSPRQTKPSVKPLWGFSTRWKCISQQGIASGIWLHSQSRGEEREKQREPAGKKKQKRQ